MTPLKLLCAAVLARIRAVLRLRRKLEIDPAKPRYICTERGAGYVFSARVDIVY